MIWAETIHVIACVMKSSGFTYKEIRGVLKSVPWGSIRDAFTFTEHAKGNSVSGMNVVYALKRQPRELYDFIWLPFFSVTFIPSVEKWDIYSKGQLKQHLKSNREIAYSKVGAFICYIRHAFVPRIHTVTRGKCWPENVVWSWGRSSFVCSFVTGFTDT